MGFGIFRYKTKREGGTPEQVCIVREISIKTTPQNNEEIIKELHEKAIRIKSTEIEALAIKLYSFGKTLDVGCGHRKKGHIGIDIERTKEVDIVASALHLPFKDETFDTVITRHVIEHVDHFDKMLKEMKRVTRSQVIISTPRKSKSYVHPGHIWHYTKEQWIKMLKTGFEIEDVLTVGVSNVFILNRWFLNKPSAKR